MEQEEPPPINTHTHVIEQVLAHHHSELGTIAKADLDFSLRGAHGLGNSSMIRRDTKVSTFWDG